MLFRSVTNVVFAVDIVAELIIALLADIWLHWIVDAARLINLLMMTALRTVLTMVERPIRVREVSAADRMKGSFCVIIEAASIVPSVITPTTLPTLSGSPPTVPQVHLIVSISGALSDCPTASACIHVSTGPARLSRAVSIPAARAVVVVDGVGVQLLVEWSLFKPLAVLTVATADVVVADIACVAVSVSIPVRSDVRGKGTASPLVNGAIVKVR